MRELRLLGVGLLLLTPVLGMSATYTANPSTLVGLWYWCGAGDTIRMLPGDYWMGSALPLTSNSPALVGVGGPAGVVMLGSGQQKAFSLGEFVYNAHIHLERITFRGLAEVIGRVDPIAGGGGSLHFTDNIVEQCGSGVLYPALRVTECSGIIARNEFRDNLGYGIGTYHTTAAIEDNEIYGSLGGVLDQCCQSPAIRRNYVHDNSGIGIDTGYWRGGPIEYNVIERNGSGLSLGSSFAVQHNIIRENTRGVYCGGIATGNAAVHYNDIYGNVEYNLMSVSESPITHDCTMNWWGSTDPVVIADGIRDRNDDPQLYANVVFEPFCVAPGCETTPVEVRSWGQIKALYRN